VTPIKLGLAWDSKGSGGRRILREKNKGDLKEADGNSMMSEEGAKRILSRSVLFTLRSSRQWGKKEHARQGHEPHGRTNQEFVIARSTRASGQGKNKENKDQGSSRRLACSKLSLWGREERCLNRERYSQRCEGVDHQLGTRGRILKEVTGIKSQRSKLQGGKAPDFSGKLRGKKKLLKECRRPNHVKQCVGVIRNRRVSGG